MPLPNDIETHVSTMTGQDFINVMCNRVWADYSEPTEDGGMMIGLVDEDAYEQFHDANVLARALGFTLINEDGSEKTWRLPSGDLVHTIDDGAAIELVAAKQ